MTIGPDPFELCTSRYRQLTLRVLGVGFIIFVFLFISIDYYYQSPEEQHPLTLRITNIMKTPKPGPKYIRLLNEGSSCSRLGNTLHREASLYAFGKHLHRKRLIDSSELKQANPLCADFIDALHDMPSLRNSMEISTAESLSKFTVFTMPDLGSQCDGPEQWEQFDSQQVLDLTGQKFQCYKNYHSVKKEIRNLFQFDDSIIEAADRERDRLFGSDINHKLCVQVRRGEFLDNSSMVEPSGLDFVLPASDYVLQTLRSEIYADSEPDAFRPPPMPNISLVLFADEPQTFGQLIRVDGDLIANRFVVDPLLPQPVTLAFANRHCDSLLLTASGSTFGFWMGYLMAEGKQRRIFYNIIPSRRRDYGARRFDFNTFPVEWRRLRLNAVGVIQEERRWIEELERDGVGYDHWAT